MVGYRRYGGQEKEHDTVDNSREIERLGETIMKAPTR